jgi:hypothetical protein
MDAIMGTARRRLLAIFGHDGIRSENGQLAFLLHGVRLHLDLV